MPAGACAPPSSSSAKTVRPWPSSLANTISARPSGGSWTPMPEPKPPRTPDSSEPLSLHSQPPEILNQLVEAAETAGDDQLQWDKYDWLTWVRKGQRTPPGEWRYWLILAGRGFGKTRAGAEWVRAQAAAGRRRIALVGPTLADVRDVMIEGQSGLISISP